MIGPFWQRSLRALPAAIAGGTAAALVVAALDARAAARAESAAGGSLYFAAFGLTAGALVAAGVFARQAVVALVPERTPAAFRAWLTPSAAGDRRERAALLALAPLFALVWFLLVARFALLLLSSSASARGAGVALSLAAVGLGVLCALLVRALANGVARTSVELPAPLRCLTVSAAVVTAILALAIATGAPSGAGGPLAMLGVLTRDELDLRPLGFAGLAVLGALAVPAPRTRGAALGFLALAILPCAATIHAAKTALAEPATALAIERAAPLAAKLLRPFRRLADRDGDGFSALFAGGDCNDARAELNPAALDVPGNGLDEDCSGADASRAIATAPVAPTPAARPKARLPERMNVVLLTIDTLRYDLGYAGNPRPLSPALDKFAAVSAVFERAYALASYTSKSLPPMLIGRYAGETHRGYSHFNRFEKADTFVAERLQRAGVRTISVQGHWYFFQNYGMERGFDVVDSTPAPRAAQAAEGDRSITSERVSDAVLAQLENPELSARPFFLWAHYTDPHAEYVAHPGFDFGSGSRAAYDGEVAFVDQHVGRVIERILSGPLAATTAIVVTSDHGEAFGEHAMIRHGFELWEELVRVPLIVRVPGFAPERVKARRSVIDVVPTILELLRQPLPDAASPDGLSGQSLLADLGLPAGESPRERPVFVDMSEGPHNAERRAYIAGDMKLVTSRGRVLGLYDLAEDAAEKRDLSSDKARLAPIFEEFQAFRRNLREVVVRKP